jgi:hypothetical protein
VLEQHRITAQRWIENPDTEGALERYEHDGDRYRLSGNVS